MPRKTMLLVTVVAVVLVAAATALAASPGDGKDSATMGTLAKKLSEKGFEYRFGSEFDRCTKAGELEPGAFRPF